MNREPVRGGGHGRERPFHTPHAARATPPAGFERTPDELRECAVRVPLARVLGPECRSLPYRASLDRERPRFATLHAGQRKLLMSEIEFLTRFGGRARTVIYVGAAPGNHTPLLADMFPDSNFVLIDPAPFHPRTVEYARAHPGRISIRNQLLTDDDIPPIIEEFGSDVLFVSDIRLTPEQIPGQPRVAPSEAQVVRDLGLQRGWVEAIRPRAFMLKMRMPFFKPGSPTAFRYLDGDIFLQVWAPVLSAETRLIGTIAPGEPIRERVYDLQWYEEAMFRFNVCTRFQPERPLVETPEIQKTVALGAPLSYDFAAEQLILRDFLVSVRKLSEDEAIAALPELLDDVRAALGHTLWQKYASTHHR